MIRKQCLNCFQIYAAEDTVCAKDGNALSTILVQDLDGSLISGRYKIEKEIGRGGMGVVYQAVQLGLDRKVALKMLLNDLSKDDIGWKRFEVEAKAASSLNHPNIIKIYEYAVSEFGLPYMVMDFVEGESLDDVLERQQRLSLAQTLPLFIEIANALNHAHKRNVVHRDLKPSNIMLIKNDDDENEKLVPLILDFGIAKIFTQPGKAALNLTKTGEVFGSPLYMSPEQCMGQPLDPRSDIYSLGCILYQALSGDTPIKGENFLNVLFNHMNAKPKSLDSVSLNIPDQLVTTIFKCLSKTPQERYNTMAQLKSDLIYIQNQLKEIGGDVIHMAPTESHYVHLEDKTVNVNNLKANDNNDSEESDYINKLLHKAESGDSEAQFDLGWAYEIGDEIEPDLRLAFHWFKSAAEGGHPQAMHKTGYMYEKGLGTAASDKRAFEWYKKAADKGEIHGERDLGYCYRYGIGVEEDLDLAFFWSSKAAQNGDFTSQCTLGDIFYYGIMGNPDIAQAIEWYLRAAEQNDAFSQHRIGLVYLNEEDHLDPTRGVMWLEQAAEQGLASAQYDLAMLYKRGKNVKVDQEKYLNWLLCAGEQENKDAVLELANFYFMRRREGKNLSQALHWLKLASEMGDEQALARYEQCKNEFEK
ncbi:MAG: serine/threonine-protein kinase [Candidatus Melainabacteria bacterium]|nr:serine/threonine-protein kinase [Candidatus Melainabacteria bacterium]